MDLHLDELLAASAPPVTPESPELRRAVDAMIAEAESMAHTGVRRRMGRVGAVGLGVALVLGAGAAAGAAGLLPIPPMGFNSPSARHITLTLPSDTNCQVTYTVAPQELADRSDQAAAMKDAERFLGAFEMSSIDIDAAITKYEQSSKAARSQLRQRVPASEMPPGESPDDTVIGAVGAELFDRLSGNLRSHGLNPDAVLLTTSHRCDTGGEGR